MKYKTFSAIYPNYIDSDKTVKLGRRIAAKDAVPGPTMQDIHEGLVRLDVRHVIQPHKGYSRDAVSRWDNPGRILVDLEGATQSGILDASPDGVYEMDDAIPDMVDEDGDGRDGRNGGRGKKQLLRKLAHVISGLPNRHRRLEAARSKQLEEEKLRQASADNVVSKAGTATSGGGGNRKKKGKKKL
jgi:signal recognition particle subunit SRP19